MRIFLWIAPAILLFIFSCTKIETTDIGSGLIPPIDGVTTLDTTFEVITNSYIDSLSDSLRVLYNNDQIIGVINNDPSFGKTTAKVYAELKPPSYKFSLPYAETLAADSAVLILSYKGAYGDTTINQNWEVHELDEALKSDSNYSVSSHFSANNVLGTQNIDIRRLKDSVNYGFENATNQIRIKLDQTFANRLMKQYDSTNAYASDSLFRVNFKGFAIGPATGSSGNALIRINLLDTNTKLALFYNYKIPDSAEKSKAVSYFRFSTGTTSAIPFSGSANYIKRDYAGSQLTKWLSNGNKNDSLVYIQTSPGTFVTIRIPGLESFKNSIIHRAELTVLQDPNSMSDEVSKSLTPPRFLLLSSYDSVKKVKINVPNDFVVNTSGGLNTVTFGGYLVQRDAPGYSSLGAYIFDISRYVQGIVTRKDANLTLRLSAPANDSLIYTYPYPATTTATYKITPSNANNAADGRIVLGGGATKSNPLRMRLRIIYSKI